MDVLQAATPSEITGWRLFYGRCLTQALILAEGRVGVGLPTIGPGSRPTEAVANPEYVVCLTHLMHQICHRCAMDRRQASSYGLRPESRPCLTACDLRLGEMQDRARIGRYAAAFDSAEGVGALLARDLLRSDSKPYASAVSGEP
jgi:hypothetical protein